MNKSQDRIISIAVDGPVGAGKSTLCDALANELDILHLDTGAMYRAVALLALRRGLDPQDRQAVEKLVQSGAADVSVRYEGGSQRTLLSGEDVTGSLRTEAVSAAASAVSRHPLVRKFLVARQQELARAQSMLIDGRDIGTVVLPDAKAKIFLTASPQKRALRRYTQLISLGMDVDYQTVLAELLSRDEQDQNREHDPLRAAPDAVVLDTSEMTFDESLAAMLDIVRSKYA
jgi:CMP/dCMP kinase